MPYNQSYGTTNHLPNIPASIKRFQKFHGLLPDGIIGPQTRQVMRITHTDLISPQQLRKNVAELRDKRIGYFPKPEYWS